MKPRWRTIGGLAALASLPVHLLVSPEVSISLAALTVGMIGAIYLGFAFSDGRQKIIAIETGAASLFALAAFGALVWSPWIAVLAFVGHGFWDYAHDHGVETAMPRWYIPFCAFYDWVFALGLSAIWILEG